MEGLKAEKVKQEKFNENLVKTLASIQSTQKQQDVLLNKIWEKQLFMEATMDGWRHMAPPSGNQAAGANVALPQSQAQAAKQAMQTKAESRAKRREKAKRMQQQMEEIEQVDAGESMEDTLRKRVGFTEVETISDLGIEEPSVGKGINTTLARRRRQISKWKIHKKIFLPDDPLVTFMNVGIFIFVFLETALIILSGAMRQWEYEGLSNFDKIIAISSPIFFGINIFFNFRIAFIDGWSLEDESLSEIRRRYMKKWFWIDLASTFPYDLVAYFIFTSTRWFRFLQFTRLLRLVKIPYLFTSSNPLKTIPKWQGLLKFIFWVLVAIHSITCLAMAIAVEGEIEGAVDTQLKRDVANKNKQLWSTFYTNAVYWVLTTLTTVGYGDFSPTRAWTRAGTIVIMLLGVGTTSYIVAGLASIFINTDEIQVDLERRKRRLSSLMHHYQVPWDVQKDAFAIYPTLLEASTKDYSDILGELPPILQDRINTHIKTSLLKEVEVFSRSKDNRLEALASQLQYHSVEPDDMLLEQGSMGDCMFFISHGLVEVIENAGDVNEEWKGNLKDGSWFGEEALFCVNPKRELGVRAVTQCDVYRLTRGDFIEVMAEFPDWSEHIHTRWNKIQRGAGATELVRLKEVKSMRRRSSVASALTRHASTSTLSRETTSRLGRKGTIRLHSQSADEKEKGAAQVFNHIRERSQSIHSMTSPVSKKGCLRSPAGGLPPTTTIEGGTNSGPIFLGSANDDDLSALGELVGDGLAKEGSGEHGRDRADSLTLGQRGKTEPVTVHSDHHDTHGIELGIKTAKGKQEKQSPNPLEAKTAQERRTALQARKEQLLSTLNEMDKK